MIWSILAQLFWLGIDVLGVVIQSEPEHRDLVRRKWTFQQVKRRAGNAALAPKLEALIVQLANDNPRLGYKKLVGELRKLGYRVGRSTGRGVLKRHHIQLCIAVVGEVERTVVVSVRDVQPIAGVHGDVAGVEQVFNA